MGEGQREWERERERKRERDGLLSRLQAVNPEPEATNHEIRT